MSLWDQLMAMPTPELAKARNLAKTVKTAPYAKGSETSKEAAKSVEPYLGNWQAQVYACIKQAGQRGATDGEIQQALGIQSHSQVPRRLELVKLSLVVDSGFVRKSPSGRRSTVWVVKP